MCWELPSSVDTSIFLDGSGGVRKSNILSSYGDIDLVQVGLESFCHWPGEHIPNPIVKFLATTNKRKKKTSNDKSQYNNPGEGELGFRKVLVEADLGGLDAEESIDRIDEDRHLEGVGVLGGLMEPGEATYDDTVT